MAPTVTEKQDGFIAGLTDIAFSFRAYFSPPDPNGWEDSEPGAEARTVLIGGISKLVPSVMRTEWLEESISMGDSVRRMLQSEYSNDAKTTL